MLVKIGKSALLFILIVLLLFVVIRGVCFKPLPVAPAEPKTYDINKEKSVQNFVNLIRCKTVSNRDFSQVDFSEYEKLHALIKETYPLVHEHCSPERIGETGLLFKWTGHSHTEPVVCIAHYDVVPVDLDGWSKPALVLDEGGAVVDHAFPGVPDECALIGIGEKGSLNVDFTLKNNGGHASTPPVHTPVG